MPGLHIHLVIGKRYIEKHEIKNEKEFLEGVIAPDFAESKDLSHYIRSDNKADIDIQAFLNENKLENDYEKGIYLHLITDKLFFEKFFSMKYAETEDSKFINDLYYSYDIVNSYLIKKYKLVLDKELEEKIRENIEKAKKRRNVKIYQNCNNILPIKKLDEFIEKISDMDLENL